MSTKNTQGFHETIEQFFDSPRFGFNLSTEQSISDTLCFILSLAPSYWDRGIQLLDQLLDLQETSIKNGKLFPPIMGGLLLRYAKYAHTEEDKETLLKRTSCLVLDYHKQLYTQYDKEEIGLIDSSERNSKQPLIDVFFHSLLIWSNQALIEVSAILKKDDVDIILWNELSIFSCQEQLWNPTLSRFHSTKGGEIIKRTKQKSTAFLPLFGNIPTQEEAEEMLKAMQKMGYPLDETGITPQVFKHSRLPFSMGYLLYQGLLNYDMEEAADCLKNYLLHKKGQNNLAKVVVLSLLNQED